MRQVWSSPAATLSASVVWRTGVASGPAGIIEAGEYRRLSPQQYIAFAAGIAHAWKLPTLIDEKRRTTATNALSTIDGEWLARTTVHPGVSPRSTPESEIAATFKSHDIQVGVMSGT